MKQFNYFNFIVAIAIYVGLVHYGNAQYVFRHKRVLVEPDVYAFNWNYTDRAIIGELKVQTNGWILFGLTDNGEMNGADVIVAWINEQDDDGHIHFTDRHIIKTDVLIDSRTKLVLGIW